MQRNLGFLLYGVALVLLGGVFGSARSCTPETCPPGPVQVFFENLNCTGSAVEYVPLASTPDVCQEGSMVVITEDALVYYSFPDVTCDTNSANASYSTQAYVFGMCRPFINPAKRDGETSTVTRAYIYLRNVNETFEESQPVFDNQDLPAFGAVDQLYPCNGPDDCSLSGGGSPQYWRTAYNDYNCNQISSSEYGIMNFETCYNYYNQSYARYHCMDEKTVSIAYYLDAECQHPFYVGTERRSCSFESTTSIHCLAQPPVAPSTPPADSPSNSPSDSPSSNPSANNPSGIIDPNAPSNSAQTVAFSFSLAIVTFIGFIAFC